MSELKNCPYCGQKARQRYAQTDLFSCSNILCELCHVVFSESEWNTRPLESALESQIASQAEVIKWLTEDANRLIVSDVVDDKLMCVHCGGWGYGFEGEENVGHRNDCPVALHRALMSELKGVE